MQRDVNIALVNELFQIFQRMDINTKEVIEAASTKWNFMKLQPGLVGGHCIGVDPYYLLHKSQSFGYIPDLMRSAREINNGMADALVDSFMKSIVVQKINPVGLRVLVLGFTFKEDCPDFRNTKVIDIYNALNEFGFEVVVYDPLVSSEHVQEVYGVTVSNVPVTADVGFLAGPHKKILSELAGGDIPLNHGYCFDFKGVMPSSYLFS